MLSILETSLSSLIHTLPLEVFAFIASFIEEILAPIPSPTVMIIAGSAAAIQQYSLWGLLLLAIIAALGKTVGAVLVYIIADKAENVMLRRFPSLFPVTHEEIEGLGTRLTGGTHDYILLTLLRAFPFMPSVVVSVGSGVLKIRMQLFIITTFIGTIVRDAFYLYFGFAGVALIGNIIERSTTLERVIEMGVIVGILVLFMYLYIRRRKLRL